MGELRAMELTKEQATVEIAKCSESFLYFLTYVKIVEAPTLDNPGGIIPFQLWPHLKQFIKALLTQTQIDVLKARQVGASILIADYCLWFAMYRPGAEIMLSSKGETEAMELLRKVRRSYEFLPDFLKPSLGKKSDTELTFPTANSSIKAHPATETAGIGYTTSILVNDEWSEHPYADQNYLASKPTRDAGGQFIGIFTANKLNPDNLATAIFRDALEGKNSFTPLFFPYTVRPGRDDAWYEETKRNIPQRELGTLTPELYMEQNYPASMEEALRSTSTVSAFDSKILDNMMSDVKNPITLEDANVDYNVVKIYKPFLIGNYYIAATDTSHGIGKDYSVTTVMNVKTGEIVADIMRRDISPEELAFHSVKMLSLYKNPLWYPEANDRGGLTIATAQRLGYKNFGYQDEKKNKIGFDTKGYATPTGLKGSRTDLFGGLIAGINNNQITIYNSEGIKQFYDVIRNVKKEGRIEALSGRHDDYPITVGICWAKKDEVITEEWKPQIIQSLHFPSRERMRGVYATR